MAIWFTADTHFNHENVIEYSARPYRDIEHMTEQLVTNWNNKVSNGDTVYHLGDFALSFGAKHRELISQLLGRLKGQKWLIKGNHDRKEVTDNALWTKVLDYHELKVDRGGEHKQRIVMSHYAMRVWNQCHRGAWMLHGHSHGNLVDVGGKTMDVGVDCRGYAPVSIEDVAAFMETRTQLELDHHKSI